MIVKFTSSSFGVFASGFAGDEGKVCATCFYLNCRFSCNPTSNHQHFSNMSVSDATTSPQRSKRLTFPDGDVVVRSVDGVKFCLHAVFLSRASPYFRDALAESPANLTITETADTFNILLQYIYPTPQKSSINSIERATSLLVGAAKLKIEVAIPAILSHLRKHLDDVQNPLRAWAIAVQCRYPAGQRDSIRRIVLLDDNAAASFILDEAEELKHVTGLHYRKLINWRGNAIANARATLHKVFEPCDEGDLEDPVNKPGCGGALTTLYEKRHIALLAGGSPFSDLATSDFMFKMAAATSGCPACAKKESTDTWMVKVGQLRAEIQSQLNDVLGKKLLRLPCFYADSQSDSGSLYADRAPGP